MLNTVVPLDYTLTGMTHVSRLNVSLGCAEEVVVVLYSLYISACCWICLLLDLTEGRYSINIMELTGN